MLRSNTLARIGIVSLFVFFVGTITAHAQINITAAAVPGVSNAGQGDVYLTSDTDVLYIGLEDGTLRKLGGVSNLSQNVATGTLNFVDENGAAQTAEVISSDAQNRLTAGSDGGAYLAEREMQLFTDQSSATQNWNGSSEQTVATRTITLTQESIVDVSYVFSYIRTSNGGGRYRRVNIDISGSTTLNNQMSTMSNTYSTSENWGHCSATRKYRFNPGTYTFRMRTRGNANCTTRTQTDNDYGWSMDITVFPTD